MTTRYLSADEYLVMFPDLANKQVLGATRTDATINTAVLIDAIVKAEAFVDSFIQVQYTLPLKSVPQVLKSVVGDVARYKIYAEKPPEHVTRLYDDAVSFLKQVASRKNMLGVPDQANAVAQGTTVARLRKVRSTTDFHGF